MYTHMYMYVLYCINECIHTCTCTYYTVLMNVYTHVHTYMLVLAKGSSKLATSNTNSVSSSRSAICLENCVVPYQSQVKQHFSLFGWHVRTLLNKTHYCTEFKCYVQTEVLDDLLHHITLGYIVTRLLTKCTLISS